MYLYQRLFILILLYFASLSQVFSQDSVKTYTVEELVDRALTRSDLLYAAEQKVQKAYWVKRQAAAWQNPLLGLGYGRKHEDHTSGNAYDFALTQPFYFPGKQRLRYEVGEMDERLAFLSLEEKRLFIGYEVIRLSYAYVATQSLIEHAQERIARFRLMKKYMRGRPFASPQAQAENVIVETKLLLFERDLALLQSRIEDFWAGLNLYLDFPEKVQIKVEWITRSPRLALDPLIQETIKNNVRLKRLKVDQEKTVKKKLLAEKEAYPDFALSGFYDREEAAGDEQKFGIGVTIDLPLLNRNQNLSKSLLAQTKEKEARLNFERDVVHQKLTSLCAQYQAALSQLELFPVSLIKKVDGELAKLDEEFRKNRIELLTYLEVEAQSYEVHVAVYESQMQFVKIYSRILFLMGEGNFEIGGFHVE